MALPHIRFEGDVKQCLVYLPEAKQLLQRVENFLLNTQANTFATGRRIDDRGYMYVRAMPGLSTIFISYDADVPDQEAPEKPVEAAPILPALYSGVVAPGFPEARLDGVTVCHSFAPTPGCQTRFGAELRIGLQKVPRLAIRLHEGFPELESPIIPVTQYTSLRATMYSGLMQPLVQAVMGLGWIDPKVFGDTPYGRFVERNGVQLQYDYKFQRTHGVTRGNDGALWLVEISQFRGIWARKVPLIPGTDTPAYRASAANRTPQDTAVLAVLDMFGGLPSGEGIPIAPKLLDPLKESGEVIQLLPAGELAPFYLHSPFSRACGWSFSPDGREAHNTGWRYGDDNYQRSVWYQCSLSFNGNSGSASVSKQREGRLYAPGSPVGRYLQFKMYDPDTRGLLSHDAAPSASLPAIAYDTVIFVSFVGGSLQTVSHYRNPNVAAESIIDDDTVGEECLLEGSWRIAQTTDGRYVSSMMYTTQFDDRKALAGQYSETNITSTSVGYNPPAVRDFPQAPEAGVTFRSKSFKRTTTNVTHGGETINSVVVVPQYSRNAYYYALGRRWDFYTESSGVSYDHVQDPNQYFHWRCFPRIGSIPWPTDRGCERGRCGGDCVGAGTHSDRRIVCDAYVTAPCSSYADSGPWMGICDGVDSLIGAATPVRPTPSSFKSEENKSEVTIQIMAAPFNGPFRIEEDFSYEKFQEWEAPSPDPETGVVQQLKFTHNTFGYESVLYDPELNYGLPTVRGMLPPQATPNAFYCYIGVL